MHTPGAALSRELVDAVEAFKTTMLDTDRRLKDHRLFAASAQMDVSAACDAVERALREHIEQDSDDERQIGAYVFRETFPYLTRSRFVDRAFTKPCGYAGDFTTIEMLYEEDTADGDGRLGPLIDRWTRSVPAAQAVRNRRSLLADSIRSVVREWDRPGSVPITSLAAGPARELLDVISGPDRPDVIATCVDIDPHALDFAAGLARQLGVADHFMFARDNVVRLSQGRGRTRIDPQALIYSLGLTDYLPDGAVVDLINWAHAHLLPGGQLIVGNVVPSNPNKAYMDHLLEWVLIHRTAEEVADLFARSAFGAAPVALFVESAGVDLFATCRKD